MEPYTYRVESLDDHATARAATLAAAVTDAANNRLDANEIREALSASNIDRKTFDSLVRTERARLAAAQIQADIEAEQHRRNRPRPKPLTNLTGGIDR